MAKLTEFVKCKDEFQDKSPLNEKILKHNLCVEVGQGALTEIQGSSIEPLMKEAIETSITRLKGEVNVFKKMQDPEIKDASTIIKQFVIPLQLVAKKEKDLWSEVQYKIKNPETNYNVFKIDWMWNLGVGIAIFFFLHYIINKKKIDERVKENNK